jgi:TatD DNase family protein
MVLTDTHTHLYYENDIEKRAGLIQRCLDNNISRLFLPNVDFSSVSKIYQLVNDFPKTCFAMLGLHPCDVKTDWETELDKINGALENGHLYGIHKIYAIGEIGIDLYWDKTYLGHQQQAFQKQIRWAKQLNLPIVVHCRDAFEEVVAILLDEKDDKLRGIFHCFSGTLQQAEQVVALGFYLGIGGVITYKNAGLDKVVKQIDLKHLVLETDSPYLTPVPHRGKPNESSYLNYIAQKVADLHEIDVAIVASVTTENSIKIFGV